MIFVFLSGLEVSVDCSESVLAAIVHYLHSGLLLPLHVTAMPALAHTLLRQEQESSNEPVPDLPEDLASAMLELCRIAAELGIEQLELLASQRFVQLCYDSFFAVEDRGADAYDSVEELEQAKVK
jgi:hypothetical protein